MRASRAIMILLAVMPSAQVLADEAQDQRKTPRCRRVLGGMVEDRTTEGCRDGAPRCFFGEVTARWLRATTYFHADSTAPGPATSPGFVSYGGFFEYTTDRGTLTMRETGVTNPTTGNPESGAVAAFQIVVGGTGEFTGATGHIFAVGTSVAGHVETDVIGEICVP